MESNAAVTALVAHRTHLLAVAYNILGEAHEAEDIVQDVAEQTLRRPVNVDVVNMRAYLARAVVNRCLDRLERRGREQATYTGPWLPEPLLTALDEDPRPDILPYAVLCLLESLNPTERAVLVLREAFGQDYASVAEICGIREDHCRQLLHRAKEKVRRPLKTPHTDEAKRTVFLQAFMEASFSGDAAGLAALLREDITLYTDGGGKAAAALKPLVGAGTVIRFAAGLGRLPGAADWRAKLIRANGQVATALMDGRTIVAVFIPELEHDGRRATTLYGMRNPDKIFFQPGVTK